MDVSNTRLFRFGKPEWLNNSTLRSVGVYTSGALVSYSFFYIYLSLSLITQVF